MESHIQATMVAVGALGGATYATLGYLKARKQGEDFEVNKFLKPVVYGACTGAAGVMLSPMVGGPVVIDEIGEAFAMGGMGSASLEKFFGSTKDSMMAGIEKLINGLTGGKSK